MAHFKWNIGHVQSHMDKSFSTANVTFKSGHIEHVLVLATWAVKLSLKIDNTKLDRPVVWLSKTQLQVFQKGNFDVVWLYSICNYEYCADLNF